MVPSPSSLLVLLLCVLQVDMCLSELAGLGVCGSNSNNLKTARKSVVFSSYSFLAQGNARDRQIHTLMDAAEKCLFMIESSLQML